MWEWHDGVGYRGSGMWSGRDKGCSCWHMGVEKQGRGTTLACMYNLLLLGHKIHEFRL